MPQLRPEKVNDFPPRWLLAIAIIFFILLVLSGAGAVVFAGMFKNKIYPNVFVGQLNLGGKTAAEAKRLINQAVDKINQSGVTFSYKNQETNLMPVITSADGDLALELISFNADQAAAAAYSYGRSDNFFLNAKNILLALIIKERLALPVLINQAEIVKILKNNFAAANEPAQDAQLLIKTATSTSDYGFTVAKEKSGKIIDYEPVLGLLADNLSKLNPAPIALTTITQYPVIYASDGLNIESQARKILSQAPLTLYYGQDKWTIEQNSLTRFLSLKLNQPLTAASPKALNNQPLDKVRVGLADDKFSAYLAEQIAPKIDKDPLEAKFEISDNRVTQFQNSQDGLALNLTASLSKIEKEITATSSIELVVEVRPALTKTGDKNALGIKEIVGLGRSNFTGSPPNRRHNIKVGGDSLNGLLIKPGEEFSLLKALGEVNAAAGYLPELVIKEGKTLPEYGGGLCQIGTTMFRAALATGLPITMRKNHSYRVVYYEPAGTDATIYSPWPDFRFINDLPNYILIQTKIDGDNLAFEFWGARDGRLATTTRPSIFNIVKPEPTRIIETLDLKPGEKKCTERAHNGADAYFDYKVAYATGEIKAKRFSSHYVPWQEVCLLGVEKLSGPPDGAASSTPAILETTPAAN